jgi:hypothetical protein
MQIIERYIENALQKALEPNKVIVLLGPRRVGKTMLLNKLIATINKPYLLLNGEDILTVQALERRSVLHYQRLLGNNQLLIIDEAQKIPNIGKILKLMIDNIEGLEIVVTGSSAFDINRYTGEPLTGRKKTYHLFPFSESEYNAIENFIEKPENLRHRLIFGNYPELIHLKDNQSKTQYLQEILNSYLLKDILTFENIHNSTKLLKLLQLIAFQIGSEISYNELAQQLGISRNTVEKYLDLLSKVFIIHNIGGFSRNLRKEIVKSNKWYFYDNGIRNVLIANLNPIDLRNDVGQLWENYLISERIKQQSYTGTLVNNYFWRTYDQQEIDWVEERGGKLYAYEFKWNEKKKAKVPTSWKNAYPDAEFKLINPSNYIEWVDNDESI